MRAFVFIALVLLWSGATSAQELQKDAEADDTGTAESKPSEDGSEPRVPWKGTALKWSQSATTTALGLGHDYQSTAGEVYTHGYWALLNYYLVDEKDVGSLRVHSSPGFDVEITDSPTTSHIREPQPRDLDLSASSTVVLSHDEKPHREVVLWPSATVLLPTSEISRDTGTYFVTSPRLSLTYETPFLPDVDFPNVLAIGTGLRWDHRFTEATEPVSSEVQSRIARLRTTGAVLPSDNLTGTPHAHDTVTLQGIVWFVGEALRQPLLLKLGAAYSREYLYDFAEVGCVEVNTGACANVTGNEDILAGEGAAYRDVTNFSVVLEYWMLPELSWSIGYLNLAPVLGPDGLRRSPFYSPGAVFTTQVMVSIDAIYEGLTGPKRKAPFILPG